MCAVAVGVAVVGLDGSVSVIVSSLVSLLWVGINEEAHSRGLVQQALGHAIGSVWPLVLVHGLDDFFQIRSPGSAPDWWEATVYVFYVAFGVWLLRRYGAGDTSWTSSPR
ncbi:hypothetical protein [Streptomyces sp. NEAU-S77]|uniref:hypothetical protein n=1 Tax=Streptomyces sp. NEAU-S77 TaxID=3411033 RepID=UPI003BA0DCD6